MITCQGKQVRISAYNRVQLDFHMLWREKKTHTQKKKAKTRKDEQKQMQFSKDQHNQ